MDDDFLNVANPSRPVDWRHRLAAQAVQSAKYLSPARYSAEVRLLAAYLRETAEFDQGVLYRCGPAQVGFGERLSSFHRLTISSRGKLSPEPLRLTHPCGVKTHQ